MFWKVIGFALANVQLPVSPVVETVKLRWFRKVPFKATESVPLPLLSEAEKLVVEEGVIWKELIPTPASKLMLEIFDNAYCAVPSTDTLVEVAVYA
jgi:hypothetical protein